MRKATHIRSKLLTKGHTLRSWALSHGYRPSTVYAAVNRVRGGKITTSILSHLRTTING